MNINYFYDNAKFGDNGSVQMPLGFDPSHQSDPQIVMDNYATHKASRIKAWLARRARCHVHFTPTSASWICQVERRFAELIRRKLQRSVHTSVSQLQADIVAFVDVHNADPNP